jgi:hypothetical protein
VYAVGLETLNQSPKSESAGYDKGNRWDVLAAHKREYPPAYLSGRTDSVTNSCTDGESAGGSHG